MSMFFSLFLVNVHRDLVPFGDAADTSQYCEVKCLIGVYFSGSNEFTSRGMTGARCNLWPQDLDIRITCYHTASLCGNRSNKNMCCRPAVDIQVWGWSYGQRRFQLRERTKVIVPCGRNMNQKPYPKLNSPYTISFNNHEALVKWL